MYKNRFVWDILEPFCSFNVMGILLVKQSLLLGASATVHLLINPARDHMVLIRQDKFPLYKSFFSFSHPSLAYFFNKARLQVWMHTRHFALHIAGWVGSFTHHHHISCGLHHTLQAHIGTSHFQPHTCNCSPIYCRRL